MKHVGLYFGSFNPIHVGHLIIANAMLENSDLDEVWFVVSPQNPFKEQKELLADYHRMAMVRRAIDDNYRLKACDVEMHLPIPSYTVVTLAQLGELYPNYRFCLLMGSDNLDHFDRWRNYQYILDNYQIKVYPRPGHLDSPFLQHPNVTLVQCPLMEISSSYIRKQIALGHSVQYLLSDPVWNYLTEMHFYEKK
ncbi:MAG: nicotinate (nicotinamide) nucleotide adenylyltransferase [Bacteroidales bacterium]|nr:nicotinate (nicotinamide) nucleotide adenylyltransferase [Bacteroidales bacterium]